jgi:hypothetical protein
MFTVIQSTCALLDKLTFNVFILRLHKNNVFNLILFSPASHTVSTPA